MQGTMYQTIPLTVANQQTEAQATVQNDDAALGMNAEQPPKPIPMRVIDSTEQNQMSAQSSDETVEMDPQEVKVMVNRNYEVLINKPKINGKVLIGDVGLTAIGALKEDDIDIATNQDIEDLINGFAWA